MAWIREHRQGGNLRDGTTANAHEARHAESDASPCSGNRELVQHPNMSQTERSSL